jgi:hypothetical protein
MQLHFKIKLLVGTRFDEPTNSFVSYAPQLNVRSQGRTLGESQDALKSAVGLFLSVHFEKNTLHDVLTKAGFMPTNPNLPNSPYDQDEFKQIEGYNTRNDVEVPWNLTAIGNWGNFSPLNHNNLINV